MCDAGSPSRRPSCDSGQSEQRWSDQRTHPHASTRTRTSICLSSSSPPPFRHRISRPTHKQAITQTRRRSSGSRSPAVAQSPAAGPVSLCLGRALGRVSVRCGDEPRLLQPQMLCFRPTDLIAIGQSLQAVADSDCQPGRSDWMPSPRMRRDDGSRVAAARASSGAAAT